MVELILNNQFKFLHLLRLRAGLMPRVTFAADPELVANGADES